MDPSLPVHLQERCRDLSDRPPGDGAFVLYWMRVALRAHENPALDTARWMSRALGKPLVVAQGLTERYRYASDRHHTFILEGARDVAQQLADLGLRYVFHLERPGHRPRWLPELAADAALVVTEDLPIAPLRQWTRTLAEGPTPVWAVDTANVVPASVVEGRHRRAYRFRKAISGELDARLRMPWPELFDGADLPNQEADLPNKEGGDPSGAQEIDVRFAPVDLASADLPALVASCEIDHTVGPVVDTVGGSTAGYSRWSAFLRRIRSYGKTRNHPLRNGVSRMSAYLHYGMVAPPRLAREAAAVGGPGPDKYLDELIVWRELANHWCAHHEVHQSLEALPEWAQDTLAAHASDRREERFDREALARGRTGDDLWDACQRSLLRHGELHNNLRMTWGKAIPQWVATPGEAIDALFELNDRYALDGRDPSSVGGLMWCLGLMDRPFSPEIPVLGEIRPRPLDHHARRLDVGAYAAHVDERGVAASGRRVAVVGAGLAGAMCARTLHDHGLRVTLFDKGRGAGGRLSTRRTDTAAFDHGAPGFSIRDRRVGRYARAWRERGLLARWQGPFGTLGPDGFEEGDWGPRFVGVPGMSQVVKHLLADLDVHFGIRVERLLRAEAGDGWQVVPEGGAPLGPFDHVVVAVPAPQAVPLLAAGAPELAAPLRGVEVAPCWSVLMEGLGDGPPWSAAKVDDGPLSFVARNHSKPGRGDTDAWVVHGSPAWSAAHLEDDAEAVAEALVGALRSLVDLPPPTVAMAHRWRYAKVTKPVGEPCLWDPEAGVGVCGDALLGGRVEAALLSGMALAGRVLGAVVEDRRAE